MKIEKSILIAKPKKFGIEPDIQGKLEGDVFFANAASPYYSPLYFEGLISNLEALSKFEELMSTAIHSQNCESIQSILTEVNSAFTAWVMHTYSLRGISMQEFKNKTPFIGSAIIQQSETHYNIGIIGELQVHVISPHGRVVQYADSAHTSHYSKLSAAISPLQEESANEQVRKITHEFIQKQRQTLNSKGAMGGFNGISSPLPFLKEIKVPRNQCNKILVCNSGFARAWSHFEIPFNDVINADFNKIAKSIRIVEESDNVCSMYPRFHQYSDIFATLISK